MIVSSVSDLTGDELQTLGQGFVTSLKQGQIKSGKLVKLPLYVFWVLPNQ